MTLIAGMRPLLKGAASICITLSEEKGCLVALIQPRMLNIDESTEDSELAVLQAALSRPVRIGLPPDGDPDAALADALRMIAGSRSTNLDSLQAYREAQSEAQNAAKLAKDKKDAAPKATVTGKGKGGSAKASAITGGAEPAPLPSDDEKDQGGAAEEDHTGSADAAGSATTATVFD